MGTSDDDSDDAKAAELDAELNRKVATVIAPLMKKLKRQRKQIDALEDQVRKQGEQSGSHIPRIDAAISAISTALEEATERNRRDLGNRVLNVDHARVEVSLTSSMQQAHATSEDLRQRLAAQEMLVKSLQHRIDEVDAGARRGTEAVEERLAALRITVSDEAGRSDSRRAELQLHISEVSAKLHAELVEAKRDIDSEIHKLHGQAAAAAMRSEVLERFASLDEASSTVAARAERHQMQLAALDETMGEVQAATRTKATTTELNRLRVDIEAIHAASASGSSLAQAKQEAREREAQWERRHLAVEHAATGSMRELRQMAANLDELGSRIGMLALAVRAMGPCPVAVATSRAPLHRFHDATPMTPGLPAMCPAIAVGDGRGEGAALRDVDARRQGGARAAGRGHALRRLQRSRRRAAGRAECSDGRSKDARAEQRRAIRAQG